jgi:hypothetical protein
MEFNVKVNKKECPKKCMGKLYEERNWKSLFLKYEVHDDRIRIQSIFPIYFFDIPFRDLAKIEIGRPPVIWDVIKKGYFSPGYGFGVRILKNDLADLSTHITIEKKNGFWKQIRITPKDTEAFYRVLIDTFQKHQKS